MMDCNLYSGVLFRVTDLVNFESDAVKKIFKPLPTAYFGICDQPRFKETYAKENGVFVNRFQVDIYTGLTDSLGVRIYTGDTVNILTRSSCFIFDCVYTISFKKGSFAATFHSLLWESFGHNQHPFIKSLPLHYFLESADYSEKLK